MASRDVWIWVLTIFAVVLNAVIGMSTVERIAQSARAIEMSHVRISEYTLLLSNMKDAETGHRGYMLTAQEEYLAPFFAGKANVPERFKALTELTANRPEQQERLRDIQLVIDRKFAEMERTAAIRKADGLEAARMSMLGGRGRIIMDELRAKVKDCIDEEQKHLLAEEAEEIAQTRSTRIIILAAAALGIGIVIAAAFAVNGELKRRMRANEALSFAKNQIEAAYTNMRQSEALFRLLAESMPQIVWMSGPDGAVDYFNRRWYSYTGLQTEQSFGEGWHAATFEDDRERTQARWAYSTLSGEAFELEYRLVRHDGASRWYLGRANPVRDTGGAIVRWLGTLTDIDDNKRLSENLERTVQERTAALTEQRTFLDAILNSVNEGIVACDAQGRLLFNRATQQIHGIDATAIAPDEWPNYYSLFQADGETPLAPDDVPLRRALRGEHVFDAEMIIRPASGGERFLLCSGQPLVNSAGRTFGAVVSMHDVTERRASEVETVQSAKLLQTSNEELEKFAYIASHDLQEPLRKIQAFGDRLGKKARGLLDAENQDSLDRILDAAGRMRRLIEDLLAFSRVSTKAKASEPVDLNRVIADVRSIFEIRFDEMKGQLHCDVMPEVMGDESQLRQLFQNLIGNALKFARPDVPPEIWITVTPLSGTMDPIATVTEGWRFMIRDNGIGFEQQYADRIFELFQRLHGRHQFDGTGLGLAISRKIVLRHGGTIQARGEPGQGATFMIDWPSSPGSA